MAIVDFTSGATSTATTSVTSGTLPVAPVSGDLCVIGVSVAQTGGTDPVTITTPTGYTIAEDEAVGNNQKLVVFTKAAGGSEPTSVTVSYNKTVQASVVYGSLTGLTASPIDAAVTNTGQGTGGTAVSLSGAAAPTATGEDGLVFLSTNGVPTLSGVTAGWTEEATTGSTGSTGANNIQLHVFSRTNLSTGSAPTFAATLSTARTYTGVVLSFTAAATKTISAPVASATVSFPAPTVTGSTSRTIIVPAASATVSFPAPSVTGTHPVTVAAPAPTLSASSGWAQPTRYLFVLCKDSGEPIRAILEAVSRKLTFQLNGVHTAEVEVRLTDPVAYEIQPGISRIKVWRGGGELTSGQLVFYGTLPRQNVTQDAGANTLRCVFADPRWVLAWRYNHNLDTLTGDQGVLAYNLIAQRFELPTWILPGSLTTGVDRQRTWGEQPVSQLLDDLTQVIDGPDFDVQPYDGWEADGGRDMALFHAYARQGTDRPEVSFFFGTDEELLGGYPTNVSTITRTWEPVVTESTHVGSAPTDDPAATTAVPLRGTFSVASESIYGLLEQVASDPDVVIQATLDQKARGDVVALSDGREVIEISDPTTEAPQPFEDYYVGDTVRVHCRRGAMQFSDRVIRIHTIEIDVDDL